MTFKPLPVTLAISFCQPPFHTLTTVFGKTCTSLSTTSCQMMQSLPRPPTIFRSLKSTQSLFNSDQSHPPSSLFYWSAPRTTTERTVVHSPNNELARALCSLLRSRCQGRHATLLKPEAHSFSRISQSQLGSHIPESFAPRLIVQSQLVFYWQLMLSHKLIRLNIWRLLSSISCFIWPLV